MQPIILKLGKIVATLAAPAGKPDPHRVMARPSLIPILLLLASPLCGVAAPPLICPAGGPIGSVDLRVRSPRGGNETQPLRTINRLEEGDTILYTPLLRSGEQRKGEVTVVLIPAAPREDDDSLIILEERKAGQPQSWTVPTRIAVVAFVYGPSGLNRKKVKSFLSRDSELVAQLADYAEKTAQAESLIAALSSPSSSAEAMSSALRGFSSQYGVSAQINRDQPIEQQTLALFRALTPAIAAYDPISAPQRTLAVGQTASLATSVAALFFGNPVSLAAGGAAMAMQLGTLAFPNAEFRSSFAQTLPEDGLGLCGQRHAPAPHTKVAYIWATRVPNVGPPKLMISGGNFLPVGAKSPVPISGAENDWKFAERARKWLLVPEQGSAVPIQAQKLGPLRSIELDVPPNISPGRYRLSAGWDWERFFVDGEVIVQSSSDLSTAHLVAASQDQLVGRTGKVPVTLEGGDFDFITKVEIEKTGDRFASPAAVPFLMPKGLRQGPQDRLDLQINTQDMDPGHYRLLLTQVNGSISPVSIKILPPPPSITNLPVKLNQGTAMAGFRLTGERLDLIERIEVAKGQINLEPATNSQKERQLTLNLSTDIPAGTSMAARVFVRDRNEPMIVADAIRLTAPRPRIKEATLSRLPEVDVELGPGELPGGAYLSAMLRVEGIRPDSSIRLGCEEKNTTTVSLKLGQRYGGVSVQQTSGDELFLSFDTGVWLNGCRLQAVAVNADEGESDAHYLGQIVRGPKIEFIEFTNGGARLTGKNLETIEQLGWSEDLLERVTELPVASASDVEKQTLNVCLLPRPSADARLIVWLKGENKPRMTRIRS